MITKNYFNVIGLYNNMVKLKLNSFSVLGTYSSVMGPMIQCLGFALKILYLKKKRWGVDETKLPKY